jgi:hypothetical protein
MARGFIVFKKEYIYHYTTPHEMVICDSGGMTGNCILHRYEQY